MINLMRKHINIIVITLCSLFIWNCRGEIIPNEEDLADYGWVLYTRGDYNDAREWFRDAVKKDSYYFDGYNGLGWSLGNLRQPDSSIYYFQKYLSKDSSFVRHITMDFYAGLAFAYNAVGKDDSARIYCTNFDANINQVEGESGLWSFSHNTENNEINYLDVWLIEAISNFRLASFQNCKSRISEIYNQYDSDNNLKVVPPPESVVTLINDVDIETVEGRADLTQHLFYIQQTIQY